MKSFASLTRIGGGLGLAAALFSVAAAGKEPARRVLDYPKHEPETSQGLAARALPANPIAVELEIEADTPAVRSAPTAGSRAKARHREHGNDPAWNGRGSRATPPPASERQRWDRIVDQARAAADSAVEASVDRGLEAHYRTGYWQGLHGALEDRRLGRRDFERGLRLGRDDPDAVLDGRAIAREAAWPLAVSDAEAAVQASFRRLDREPRFEPHPTAPEYAAAIDLALPLIDELIAEMRVGAPFPADRGGRYLRAWNRPLAELVHCDDPRDLFDAGWADPARAWARLSKQPRWSRLLSPLRVEERELFLSTFERRFRNRLAARFGAQFERARSDGFEDGWCRGADVRRRQEFRLGYREGFERAALRAADRSFPRIYDREFADAYQAAFGTWERSVRVEVQTVRFRDGDGDGIFEPGEAIRADVELANFGGRAGEVRLALRGAPLSRTVDEWIEAPARRGWTVRGVTARVSDDAAVSANGRVAVEVDGSTTRVALPVRWAVTLEDATLFKQSLEGRLRVDLDVVNRSEATRAGVLTLALPSGRRLEHQVMPLAPGARRRVGLEVDGIAPLDLLEGDWAVELQFADERPKAAIGLTVPSVASRPDDPELLRFIALRAEAGDLSLHERRRVQDLFVRQLYHDWRAAVRARGNPYKNDYKRGSGQTALGRLVQTYRQGHDRFRDDRLFDGLSLQIETAVRDLPGFHPFLRKYARRLADRLS